MTFLVIRLKFKTIFKYNIYNYEQYTRKYCARRVIEDYNWRLQLDI